MINITMYEALKEAAIKYPKDMALYYEGKVISGNGSSILNTGYYWSSTVYNNSWWDSDMGGNGYWSAYNLLYGADGNYYPSWSELSSDRKHYGDAVRCVAR